MKIYLDRTLPCPITAIHVDRSAQAHHRYTLTLTGQVSMPIQMCIQVMVNFNQPSSIHKNTSNANQKITPPL
ncbi:hypothetical protein ACOSQ2_029565 [Xanthoceras sorbifolium]